MRGDIGEKISWQKVNTGRERDEKNKDERQTVET